MSIDAALYGKPITWRDISVCNYSMQYSDIMALNLNVSLETSPMGSLTQQITKRDRMPEL